MTDVTEPNVPTSGDQYEDEDIEMKYAEDQVGQAAELTADGGVLKKILKAGTGWEKPEYGDQVFVHYTGTLHSDGIKFDSSVDRNEPFKFDLGKGQVIKGWDQGVKTMKKGEKALLTIKPEYGYGEQGSPPTIPGNATLDFEVELLSWNSVKDITPNKDGGIIKTILTEGQDWASPKNEDEVLVQYVITNQDGTETLKQAAEGGEEFVVSNSPIPAFATALKTMKKQEKVSLVIKPPYGLGEATIKAELELLSWKKVVDVTKDGGVIKRVLKDSSDYKTATAESTVKVRLTGKLSDGTVFEEHQDNNLLEFVVGEEQVCQGLDEAVQTMKVHEVAEITVQPQYGYKGQNHEGQKAPVPANSTLQYMVELVELHKPREGYEMEAPEKLQEAGKRKDAGNALFKQGKWQRALKKYQKGVEFIEHDDQFSDQEKKQSSEIKKSCNLNLAAVHLKLNNVKEACRACNKVLEKDSSNVKALFRRAQAYMATQDYIEARQDLDLAIKVDPTNRDLRTLLKKLKVDQAAVDKKQAQMYSRAFKRMAQAPQEKQSQAPSQAQDTSTNGTIVKEQPSAEADMKENVPDSA